MHAARKLALAISLYAVPVLILPVAGAAHATQAKKKKAKSPKSSAKAKSRAESDEGASAAPTHSGPKKIEKVTAGNSAKWVKRGDSETDIIARADAAGYIVNTKDEKVLKKAKVPGTLIASLKFVRRADPLLPGPFRYFGWQAPPVRGGACGGLPYAHGLNGHLGLKLRLRRTKALLEHEPVQLYIKMGVAAACGALGTRLVPPKLWSPVPPDQLAITSFISSDERFLNVVVRWV